MPTVRFASYQVSDHMVIDEATKTHLELVRAAGVHVADDDVGPVHDRPFTAEAHRHPARVGSGDGPDQPVTDDAPLEGQLARGIAPFEPVLARCDLAVEPVRGLKVMRSL